MSNYTKATNFTSKDSLTTGDPSKTVLGAEIDTEYTAISTAIATKADTASPTFTGTVTLPTVAGNRTDSGNITRTGTTTMSGKSYFDANASIAAHATTMDPWSLGNYVTLTGGAVTFTAMANAPQAGAEVELYMNAAHIWTDGAVFEVDGDATWTSEAGDRVILRAKSTTVFTVTPIKKTGSAIAGIGVNQTWQNVTGSRAKNTVYQNTTGRTIQVNITFSSDSSATNTDVYVETANPPTVIVGRHINVSGVGATTCISFIVPNNHYYKTSANGTVQIWSELR